MLFLYGKSDLIVLVHLTFLVSLRSLRHSGIVQCTPLERVNSLLWIIWSTERKLHSLSGKICKQQLEGTHWF